MASNNASKIAAKQAKQQMKINMMNAKNTARLMKTQNKVARMSAKAQAKVAQINAQQAGAKIKAVGHAVAEASGPLATAITTGVIGTKSSQVPSTSAYDSLAKWNSIMDSNPNKQTGNDGYENSGQTTGSYLGG